MYVLKFKFCQCVLYIHRKGMLFSECKQRLDMQNLDTLNRLHGAQADIKSLYTELSLVSVSSLTIELDKTTINAL